MGLCPCPSFRLPVCPRETYVIAAPLKPIQVKLVQIEVVEGLFFLQEAHNVFKKNPKHSWSNRFICTYSRPKWSKFCPYKPVKKSYWCSEVKRAWKQVYSSKYSVNLQKRTFFGQGMLKKVHITQKIAYWRIKQKQSEVDIILLKIN